MTEYRHVERSETSHGMFTSFKKLIAFSLVELMISLITISCIAAAFTPVITKKLKKQDVALSLAQTSEISDVCGKDSGKNFGNDTDGYNCKLCTKAYCVQCGLTNCGEGNYIDQKTCTCKSCKVDGNLEHCLQCVPENGKLKCVMCEKSMLQSQGYYLQKKDTNGNVIGEKSDTCSACSSGKYCEDGIYESSKSTCANPPKGYFCDNKGELVSCGMKFDPHCNDCDSTRCKGCALYYRFSGGSCIECKTTNCYVCTADDKCTQCTGWTVYNSQNNTCPSCIGIIPGCYGCKGDAKDTSSVVCTNCYGGYYLTDGGKSCSKCDGISNCIDCDSSTGKCTLCKKGYYLNSSGTCVACNITNCAVCLSDGSGKCASCEPGYYLENNKCIQNDRNFRCSDSNFMQIGKYCFTRRNMGDSSILKIPYSVNVVATGEHCLAMSQPCCWQGNTDWQTSSYSGYNPKRTACNFYAAKEICENFHYAGKQWRLPKSSDVGNLKYYSYGLGSSGLQLAYQGSGAIGSYTDKSSFTQGCVGGNLNSYCHLCYVWGAMLEGSTITSHFYSQMDSAGGWTTFADFGRGVGVRCVTEMD